MIQIYNAINPLGTNVDVFGDPVLAEFARDHAPPNADKGGQRVVWLSREDCSVLDEVEVDCLMDNVRHYEDNPEEGRFSASRLLNSFCPIKSVDVLVNYRKLAPDFCGVIAFDHELPAWCSSLHGAVYAALKDAIGAVYPNARVYEFGSMPTDYVRSHDGRAHEAAVMNKLGAWSPCCSMPHLYVPSPEYIADVNRWGEMCRDNVNRWNNCHNFFSDTIIAINPILQTGPAWSDGKPVPVPAMTAIVEAAADAGMPLAIWQAGNTDKQFGRIVEAIAESVVPAVAAVEGRSK